MRYIAELKKKRPTVHCITNYVTANDCANILLACGALPVMADDPAEAGEITSRCAGLVLNLGVLSGSKLEAMLRSADAAGREGIPVVLDPVGVGASAFRYEAALKILQTGAVSVIRANASEVYTLLTGSVSAAGVDSDENGVPGICRRLAVKTGAVIMCTGERDVVADSERCTFVEGGHPMLKLVTGAGCQLSALTGAFTAAAPLDIFGAAAEAALTMKRCGELAYKRMGERDGNATYRNYLIDEIYLFSEGNREENEYEIHT